MPYLSCVMTAFNEGGVARTSIESLLAQTFEDFEIIVVDDGADDATRKVLDEYTDPRIVRLRQANDGLSSARNRGLSHCKGEYVCFLDADDMRPAWAFEKMAETAKNSNADCIFSKGILVELRGEVLPFYDTSIFEMLQDLDAVNASDANEFLHLVMLLEPQAANKCIKRSFLEMHKLAFPNGLFFEDMLFHMVLVAHLKSYALVQMPIFTYFRRYGRPQITSGNGLNRFDAISMAFMTLDMFLQNQRFENKKFAIALILNLFRLIKWCEESISLIHRQHFRMAVVQKLAMIDSRYIDVMNSPVVRDIVSQIDWPKKVFQYFNSIKGGF